MMHDQTSTTTSRKKRVDPVFTLTQANRSLVLVRRIVDDLVSSYSRLLGLKQERDHLREIPARPDRIDAVTDRITECVGRLNRLHQELLDVGCVLKDWERGLVDFPAMRDGRRVWLCWHLGEDEVGHWHELHEGIAGRKAVDGDFAADRHVG